MTMRKFTFFLMLFTAFAMTAVAQIDYTPSFTGTRSSSRYLSTIRLSSPSYPDHAANSIALSSSEQQQNYVDKTTGTTMKVGAGETVTLTVSMNGTWMHSYAYIDVDGDGFTASIANGSDYQPAGDLVSYSFYNNNSSSDERGWNSAGSSITGDARNTLVLPQFTTPATVGTYRMRIKLDWCNIDPNGDQDGKFGDFTTNGGHIIDVMLEVAEMQQTVSNIFSTTTIENNDFAQSTTWYTLQIAANGYVINNGSSTSIALNNVKSDINDDSHLWAFVGDNTNGYRLYNKQEGASKVLAAPTAMSGSNGGSSFPILVDKGSIPQGYTDLWIFEPSSDLGEGDTYYYMYEKGYPANKVNNRDNILAFWSSGADAGSTLNVRFAKAEYPININSGSWTASNAAGTWASAWRSNATPSITLSQAEAKNNMATYDNDGNIQLFTCLDAAAVNGVYSSVYNISAEEGYSIGGYRFDFVSSGTDNVTVTPTEGNAVIAGSTAQNVTVSGKEETQLSFTVSASSNLFANTSNFYATIIRSSTPVEPSTEIFSTATAADIPYRIPAIATAYNGDIIAVADYRHSRADIGMASYGRIDLHARISNDNGTTWNEKFSIVDGQGSNSGDFMHVGFGDPCIVADRESSRVLVMSCAGNVSFPSGTRYNHQNIARFYSENNGATWSEPEDIAESIYSQFDASSNHGPVMAMFIGSGKIHQSRYVKVNNYYRLYCAVLLKNRNATYTNFVLYSDDFGGSWSVLGGVETAPIPDGADEPKVEELPNGNIIISSRCTGGRHFNIFTFTNAEKAEGSWGTRATSNSSVNGVVALGNSCNGEIMILPVVRNEDKAEMWLALQSLPFGSGRNNVGIYYKELATESDYNTPSNFAKDWDGRHQASYLPSAYSTMCLQKDTTIAFLYEEDTYGVNAHGGYCILYKKYSLEQITDSAYSILADKMPEPEPEEPSEATIALIADAKELLAIEGLGYPATAPREVLQAAIEKAEANPTASAGATLEAAIEAYYTTNEIVLPEASKVYTFTAVYKDAAYYIYNNNGTLAVAANTGDELPETAKFTCEYDSEAEYGFQFKTSDGEYYIAYPSFGGKSWLDGESTTGLEATSSSITKFQINTILNGGSVEAESNEELFGLVKLDGCRGYHNTQLRDDFGPIVVKHSALTFDGAGTPFYNSNFTSAFRIEEVEEAGIPDGIYEINTESDKLVIYDITGRKLERITDKGIYIINGKKTFVK